jgi:DNA-binding transcriptional ArsR family regulator
MEPESIHKALSSEVRQRILLVLAKDDCYLSEIANKINLAPQTADFHLNLLSEIGLVTYDWRSGKKYYHLKDRKILEYLKDSRPIPPHFHHKPPHEIVIDAWEDLSKRMEALDKKMDTILKLLEKRKAEKG